MTRHLNVASLLSSLLVASALAAAPAALAQTKEQQNCINAMNKAGAKVAATQGKENSGCVKAAGSSKLVNPTTDACVAADNKTKVAGAQTKTTEAEASKCSSPFPTFGYTSAATINAAAEAEEVALLGDIFGSPVHGAMIVGGDGAKCQASAIKSVEKLAATRMKAFLGCKKLGLKDGVITNAGQLQTCITTPASADPKAKVSGAKTKLTDTVTKACEGVTLATAFPGDCTAETGTPAALGACLAREAECHMCLLTNTIDGLDIACDAFDDGMVNQTCRQCGNGATEGSEACDDAGDSATCDFNCTLATCGDGYTNAAAGETCDTSGETAGCDDDCSAPSCGDGNLNETAGEVCDDGNLDDDDGCDSNCTVTACGNGIVTSGETCDDSGNSLTCDSDCTAYACGDNFINPVAGEDCDVGGGETAGCDPDCTDAECGDSYINATAGEICDDGNAVSGDYCSATCQNGPGSGENDPQCPDVGELVLFSKMSNVACTDNNDCTEPRTCDTSIGTCTTVADLDSGWKGLAQDSDINDAVATRARLLCEGPDGPTCGECEVAGIDPSPGNCRCAGDVRQICDEPFVADPDCPGMNKTCNCFFGAPFPLNSAGTHVCVVNRFSEDLTGTANVDLGAGEITAKLRAQVFLGEVDRQPCPFCGGTCSVTVATKCANDAGCPMGETCELDTPGDGIRDGVCVNGAHNGLSCDAIAYNPSFPAVYSTPSPGSGGGLYSIDCQPDVGKNVSGQGLKIQLDQTTGLSSLTAALDCDGDGPLTDLCPCKVCSNDNNEPCSSDAHCETLPSTCTGVTGPPAGIISCLDDTDCQNKDAGTCTALSGTACSLDFGQACTTNADCLNLNQGTCAPSFCNAIGAAGELPEPNDCAGGACSDIGGGEGECTTGPDDGYCDGLVRADGSGMKSCTVNADCTAGLGACTQVDRRDCFLDTIEATGAPDPEFPVAGAVFCIPPTSANGINSVAGLPGPGRVVSQGAAATFCSSDNNVQYQPGIGGCP